MKKNGKVACNWCGKVFQKKTARYEYTNGTAYHLDCAKKIGGRNDLITLIALRKQRERNLSMSCDKCGREFEVYERRSDEPSPPFVNCPNCSNEVNYG